MHDRHAGRRAARWIGRRLLVALAAVVPLTLTVATGAGAQAPAYPVKPVRLIVPVAPSGGSDPLARLVASKVSERLGQPFIVENMPGAAGLLAVQTVAKAAPDAYTLIINSSKQYY